MNLFDRYTSIFWDKESDPKATHIYEELINRSWTATDFSIGEDRPEWVKIDANDRLMIVRAMITANSIKQSIGCVFLPLLNSSIGLEQIPRRAVISAIESRLNGEHSRLDTKLIFNLSSRGMVNRALEQVRSRSGLKKVLEQTDVVFSSMVGWSAANNSGIPFEGKSTYDEMNLHIWKASALATVLLESASSMPVALLMYEMEKYSLPQVLGALQTMLVDISLATTYFAELAFTKFDLLPQEKQKETYEWLDNILGGSFTNIWENSLEELEINGDRRALVIAYTEYNTQKALSKLGKHPVSGAIEMPELINKMLNVDAQKAATLSEKKKKSVWFQRRKQ